MLVFQQKCLLSGGVGDGGVTKDTMICFTEDGNNSLFFLFSGPK